MQTDFEGASYQVFPRTLQLPLVSELFLTQFDDLLEGKLTIFYSLCQSH